MRFWTLGILAALGVLSCAGSASAQTRTSCHQFGSGVSCTTTPDPMDAMRQSQQDLANFQAQSMAMMASGPAPIYRWQDVIPKVCSTFDRVAANGNLCDARAVAANRKAVGDLIGEGRCPDALKAALGTGDLVFAREVRDFCQPAP